MVSIMPGIENTAPDRTDTSSGSRPSPSRLPTRCSRVARCSPIWSSRPTGCVPPLLSTAMQASVVTVKPSGTGRPIEVISARFAPLPPSSGRRSALPSEKS